MEITNKIVANAVATIVKRPAKGTVNNKKRGAK